MLRDTARVHNRLSSTPDGRQGRDLRAVTGSTVQCPQGMGTAGKAWPPDSRAAASAPSLANRGFHKSQIQHTVRPSSSFSRDRDGSPATHTGLPFSPEQPLTAGPVTRGASAAEANVPLTTDERRSLTGVAAQRGQREHAVMRQGRAGPSGTRGRGGGLGAGGSTRPRHRPGSGSSSPGQRRPGGGAGPRPAASWSRRPRGGDGPP